MKIKLELGRGQFPPPPLSSAPRGLSATKLIKYEVAEIESFHSKIIF